MMDNKIWRNVIVSLTLCFTLSVMLIGRTLAAPLENSPEQQKELKRACLAATITAINLEIERYQGWIDWRKKQGNERDLLELTMQVKSLQRDLEKYRQMDVNDFELGEEIHRKGWVSTKAKDNVLLNVDGMTKMGPFYHLAGIVGNDYPVLEPQKKYEIVAYKVYPRNYWHMESDYIYIAELKKLD